MNAEQKAEELAEKLTENLLERVLGGRKGLDYRAIVQDEEIQIEIEQAVTKAILRELSLVELIKDKERLEHLIKTGQRVAFRTSNVSGGWHIVRSVAGWPRQPSFNSPRTAIDNARKDEV